MSNIERIKTKICQRQRKNQIIIRFIVSGLLFLLIGVFSTFLFVYFKIINPERNHVKVLKSEMDEIKAENNNLNNKLTNLRKKFDKNNDIRKSLKNDLKYCFESFKNCKITEDEKQQYTSCKEIPSQNSIKTKENEPKLSIMKEKIIQLEPNDATIKEKCKQNIQNCIAYIEYNDLFKLLKVENQEIINKDKKIKELIIEKNYLKVIQQLLRKKLIKNKKK